MKHLRKLARHRHMGLAHSLAALSWYGAEAPEKHGVILIVLAIYAGTILVTVLFGEPESRTTLIPEKHLRHGDENLN